MQYRSEVISVTGFVQQIACSFLRHGYWFYVKGCIPAGKDARSIDCKLVEKYGIAMSESTRARRKQLGFALNLRHTPALHFVRDTVEEKAERVSSLIEKIEPVSERMKDEE